MGMNDTPSGERVHIGFFGRRNAGKSSVVNAVTGQALAVVSDVKGTTTDPVKKAMELLPLGPVVIIDTPGFDDEGTLGGLRVQKTRQILAQTDLAVLVTDAAQPLTEWEAQLQALFEERGIPWVLVRNKADLLEKNEGVELLPEQRITLSGQSIALPEQSAELVVQNAKNVSQSVEISAQGSDGKAPVLYVSAKTGAGIPELKEWLAHRKGGAQMPRLIGDKLSAGDVAVLVVPIDSAAPKGRLILPQQQTIRDILDADAAALVTKEDGLEQLLGKLGASPRVVITDSQVFGKVAKIVPREVYLTSFSILMARRKGLLEEAVKGAEAVRSLQDGDRVLIAEGCTHHRQCEDIGTVKLPRWLLEGTGKKLEFSFCSGTEFPEDLTGYALVVHCGGCMLNEREVQHRMRSAAAQGVPITNYGTLIASLNGILERSLEILRE